MTEWSTHIEGFQAVPAESVFAVLTHHLRTAFVTLNVHFAFGTTFDGCIVLLILVERAGKKRNKNHDYFNRKSLHIHFSKRAGRKCALVQ